MKNRLHTYLTYGGSHKIVSLWGGLLSSLQERTSPGRSDQEHAFKFYAQTFNIFQRKIS